jgi:hypothetical protein
MTEPPKEEPATKEDVAQLRREMNAQFDKNSQEHGSIITVVRESARDYESAVEAMRKQNSNEHGRMQVVHDWVARQVDRLLKRFGFLDDRVNPEPPYRSSRDKTWPGDKK